MPDPRHALAEHQAVIRQLDALIPQIELVAGRMARTVASGGKILWLGNGGSAADSQHLAAELVGRFARERLALPSIALTTDTSILTALGNDYGFEQVFARQIMALCRPEDLVVAISTSGNSPNVLGAVRAAVALGAYTVGLTGAGGGQLRELVHACLAVPSNVTARVQEAHILIGHMLCECVEAACTS